MSFALLAPLGLVALAALALPLLIHLVRRIELRTTSFAALRWISERVKPRRKLRFERPWLLALRLALLALFALLLARPAMIEPATRASGWVLVAPGADLSAARAAVSSSQADWRWLAPGFPPIDAPSPSNEAPLSSLLREADAIVPSSATLAIVAPQDVAGLDGERAALSRDVEWHVVAGRSPSNASPAKNDAQTIAIRYAPSSEPTLRIVRAAVDALNARPQAPLITLDAQPLEAPMGSAASALVVLGAAPTPAMNQWIDDGGVALVDASTGGDGAPLWRNDDGRVLARAATHGRGRIVSLSAPLAPATFPAVLDSDFPQRLRDLLAPAAREPTRGPADALRPTRASPPLATSPSPDASKPLDPWLVLSIALLVLIERIVAIRPRSAV
jgi:hypothetical protein